MTEEKPFIERRTGYPELLERVARIEKALEETREALNETREALNETREALKEGRKMHEVLQKEMMNITNLFTAGHYTLKIMGWLGAGVLSLFTAWQWLATHFTFGLKQ